MTLLKRDTFKTTLHKHAGEGGDGRPGYCVPPRQTATPELTQEAAEKKVCTRRAREETTRM